MIFDAISFLNDYIIPYDTEGKNTSEGWVNINCPMCMDTSNHGGFNLSTGYFNCWKCGKHYITDIISNILNIGRDAGNNIFKLYLSDVVIPTKYRIDKLSKVEYIKLPGNIPNEFHRGYLENRGFDSDFIIKKYNLKGTSLIPGEWKLRIIIPIYYKNQLVSFQGRDVTNKQYLRYKTLSPEKSIMSAKNLLYNIDNCKKNKVVVVEGCFNVWKFGNDCVATFGTSMTDYQIKELTKFDCIFFLYDSEKEAQKKAREKANILNVLGKEVELIDLEFEDNSDIADMKYDDINYLRRDLGI